VRLAQVAAFGSVALYAAYYVGEAKLEASTLYIVVGALANGFHRAGQFLDRGGLLWRQHFFVWRLLDCQILPQILRSFR
jgi:hypothetical protein